MTRQELQTALTEAKAEYRSGLQQLWDAINKGQRKQIAKIPEVRAMLERYGVDTEA